MRIRTLTCAAVLALATAAGPARAATPVDARVRLLFEHRDRTGRTLPFYRRAPAFEASGRAPLLVRFARALLPAERSRYEALGADFGRTFGSGASKVRARPEALEAMLADGIAARVSVDLPLPRMHRPLDLARSEVGVLAGIAAHRRATGMELTGAGVVLGDMDSGVDVFHPAFFRPLPPVAWIDADGDGALTPGVDGVDVDGSLAIEPAEVLRQLDGVASDLFDTKVGIYGTGSSAYDPGWDYLYLDQNGDGRRNVGAEVAGADMLPSLGEAVYVADDVDGDGAVRQGERVVPLGASKLRAVRSGGLDYRRGENLASYQAETYELDHGTRMLSLAAGGQIGASRFLGVAPEAELLMNVDDGSLDSGTLLDDLQWLVDEGADVVLTELGYFGVEPSDGSSELELLIDSVVAQGVVVVSPAGNLGFGGKHARATIPAAGGTPYQNELVLADGAGVVFMSVTWREGNVALSGALTLDGGDVVDLGVEEASGRTAGGRQYSVALGTTSKGAGYLLLALAGDLPPDGNALVLETTAGTAANAALYLTDDVSAWAGGASFANSDVDGCMNSPAFAAKTIALSAYAFHTGADFTPYPGQMGELRGYSGRGPDLWGDPGIDIAAPDNPVSAAPDLYNGAIAEGLSVRWSETGGTSGAGGVVAGIAVLAQQAHPDLAGEALRSEILAGARVDAMVSAGTPEQYGAGKIDVGIGPAPGAPPTVSLLAPAQAPAGAAVTLVAELADDGDLAAAQVRWDFDYDGTWDTPWQSELTASVTMPAAPPLDVKLEAMDADGWTDAASARIAEGEATPTPSLPTGEDDGGCGCRLAGSRRSGTALAWLALGLVACRRARRSPRC